MSIFDTYEKELCDKEKEEAEIVASNEYQKELDEGLPHIEKLEDGSWVAIKKCLASTRDEIEHIKQDLLDELDKQMTKAGCFDGSKYVVETSVSRNEVENNLTIRVKFKKEIN